MVGCGWGSGEGEICGVDGGDVGGESQKTGGSDDDRGDVDSSVPGVEQVGIE
ncbi:hypothetical protein ES703_57497 [subsurface metagenome]